MFFLLNGVMLYAVIKTRFAIKRMPNLLVNENLVLVHVLLFTVVTALRIAYRVYDTSHGRHKKLTSMHQPKRKIFSGHLQVLIPSYLTLHTTQPPISLTCSCCTCSTSSPSSKASSTTPSQARISQFSLCSRPPRPWRRAWRIECSPTNNAPKSSACSSTRKAKKCLPPAIRQLQSPDPSSPTTWDNRWIA